MQGTVTSSEHGKLTQIASENQTTIGQLVTRAVKDLIADPARAKKVERDGRRK